MESWLKVSLLLCLFGFLKEIRPSEPFIYEYLTGPWWNLTEEVVQQEVYPIAIYSYLANLAVVFLITDLARYKPLIVLMAVVGAVIYGLLIWTSTLIYVQIVEILYGTFMAAEVAYYTYIYAKVPKEYFAQVTSHTRAAILAGRFVSSVAAQVLVYFTHRDYRLLNYVTFAAMVVSIAWSVLLPSVEKSVYFHRESSDNLFKSNYKSAFVLMRRHFADSFSAFYVVKWSLWWALATAGFLQVQSYMQPLWSVIVSDKEQLQNGAVEAALTLVGFLGALSTAHLRVDWRQKGELVLAICSIVEGALMILNSQTESVLISYVCYVAFGGVYHFMITIASAEVAKHIAEDSYGLVFGLNTLAALVVQTVMATVLVTGDVGWALAPRDQFLAYGTYHIGIAVLFIVIGTVAWLKSDSDVNKIY